MKPLVGILQSQKKPPSYFKLEQVGFMDLMIFTPADIQIFQPIISGLLLKNDNWVPSLLPIPKAVYNQVYTRHSIIATRLAEKVGPERIFNIFTQFDKWVVAKILQSSNVKELLPRTQLYTRQALSNFLKTGSSIIIKPRYGHLGFGIHLLKYTNAVWQLFAATTSSKLTFQNENQISRYLSNHLSQSRWIMQEFISSQTLQDRIFDLRYLVQKNPTGKWEVTGRLSRVALKGYFVTNICKTILEAEQFLGPDLQVQLDTASLSVAEILAQKFGLLGEISVDYILDRHNKPWIIEVNGLPTKELFLPLKQANVLQKIHRYPLEYAYHLATS